MFGNSSKHTLLVAPACEEITFQLVKLLITWPVKSAKAVGGGGSVSMHWNLEKKNRPEGVKEKKERLLVKLCITWLVNLATAGGAGKNEKLV